MNDAGANPMKPDGHKCPQCGTPLPTGALAGLCPACLLKQGAAADTVSEGNQPPFTPPPVSELAPLFPQLEILELVGKGGMGAVYKARQKQLERVVALKILPPGIGDDPAFAERFTREARALAKLNHPGIVTLYEFGQVKQSAGASPALLYFFLMEFVDGVNLRQLLHAGRISPREALAIVPQICDALQFAHDQGIVHRDIKPENILLDRRGRVKVADFGLAKIVGANTSLTSTPCPSDGEREPKPGEENPVLTDAGKVMGTPQYMAPEQVSHPAEVDHRADIYALGVVFYQMLTGELPGKLLQPPSTKVHIDVRLDEVVLRALAKRPELRFQQVSEVKTGLETIAASASGQSPPSPTTQISDSRSAVPNLGRAAGTLAKVPWQIWVVSAMLALEGLGNLISIPRQPQALIWLAAKVLFVTGLLRRWRPVFVLVLLISAIHVCYFAIASPLIGLLNLVLLILVATTYRFYFHRETARTRAGSSENIFWFKAGAWLAWALALPAIGFGAFFLYALASERGGWHPNPVEAVVVPLVWAGALGLPVAGWLLFRAARQMTETPGNRSKSSGFGAFALGLSVAALVIVVLMTGGYLASTYEKQSRAVERAQKAQREAAAQAALASGQSSKSSFSPVIERTLSDWDRQHDALDLETGHIVIAPAAAFGQLQAENGEWFIHNGIDLITDTTRKGVGLATTRFNELRLVRLTNDDWETATPQKLKQALAQISSGLPEERLEGAARIYIVATNMPPPVTLAFQTGNGTVGIMQLTRFGLGNQPSVSLRYKLVQKEAARTSAIAAVTSKLLGAENEVTLTEFNNMDGQEALDLDTGAVFRQPRDMDAWSDEDLGQWVKENGVDLLVDHGPGGVWGLLTITDAELKLAHVGNEKWGGISAGELERVLAAGPTGLQIVTKGNLKIYVPSKQAQSPITFAFETSSGGVGVLQIIGYTQDPRGVKIRYKLVHGVTEITAPALGSAPESSAKPEARWSPALEPRTEFAAKLPDGTFVELVSLMYGSTPKGNVDQTKDIIFFWRQDGTLLDENIGWAFGPGALHASRDPSLDYRAFVVRWGGPLEAQPSLQSWEFDGKSGAAGSFRITPHGESPRQWLGLIQGFEHGQSTATVRFALASGPFVAGPSPGSEWSNSGDTPFGSFLIGKVFDRNGTAAVTLTHNLHGCDYRLRMKAAGPRKPDSLIGGLFWEWKQEFRRDVQRQPILGRIVEGSAMNRQRLETWEFPGVSGKDAGSITLEVRPVHWVEFRNVALNPGKLTHPEIRIEDAADELAPANAVVAFGPDIERVIPDFESLEPPRILRVLTGEVVSVPDDIFKPNDPTAIGDWVATNRALAFINFGGDSRALSCGRWRFGDLPETAWEHESPGDIGAALATGTRMLELKRFNGSETAFVIPESVRPPLNLAFETALGDRGIMQIVEISRHPRSIRLRYKLVRPQSEQ